MSRGWIVLCHFCRCGCGCGVRGDLEIRHRSVLVDLECSNDASHNFVWLHSWSTRARSSSSFVALVDFKLQLRHQDTMAEPSRRVRSVVLVFDLLLNFQFVFSHLDTFGRRLLDSVLLSDFVLDLFVDVFSGLSAGPSLDPLLDPPSKVTPFLLTALHRTVTFRSDRARAPFWVSGGHLLFSECCCGCGAAQFSLGIRLSVRRRCVSIFEYLLSFLKRACSPRAVKNSKI